MQQDVVKFKPVHPFPARMAPSIALDELPIADKTPLRVLDPMAGSGTTLLAARTRGHEAHGFDTDPLALLIADVWCADVNRRAVAASAEAVHEKATGYYRRITQGKAYPRDADEETNVFIRYWFDATNRRQLRALADAIEEVRNATTRKILWCAFSRLIIAKARGASYAMDLSHSRPHKVANKPLFRPLPNFRNAVKRVLENAPFCGSSGTAPRVTVREGDARNLPLLDSSVDIVITSPPYLNAIDYLRCNKFSLVWMGHKIPDLRELRAGNIGTEVGADIEDGVIRRAVESAGQVNKLPDRDQRMLARYAQDMDAVVGEIARVLRPKGRCVLVVGDCTMRGVFVRNSEVLKSLAYPYGLKPESVVARPLEANRRYLPPPTSDQSGSRLQGRMREEIVLTLVKQGRPVSPAMPRK
jgi:SAM-dependent methyltransferase